MHHDPARQSQTRIPRPALVIIIAVVAGGIVGGASVALDLPFWLIIPAFAVVVFFWSFRSATKGIQARPVGPVVCPRCGREPRIETGWCGPCTRELEAAASDPAHPARVFSEAMVDEDLKRATACLAPRLTAHQADGSTQKLSRANWRRGARLVLWGYRGETSVLEAFHVDPASSDVAWVRTYSQGRGRLLFPAIDMRVVMEYRLTDGLISEMSTAPALPGGHAPVA